MRYVSTRGRAPAASLSDAIARGLAPDGGLYVPEVMPRLEAAAFAGADTLAEVGERLLAPFFAGDPLEAALGEICREAFSFPIPLRELRRGTSVLELFHGPTAAFKDVGARFLAGCLARLARGGERELTILVATSGDTGGAVAAACAGRPGLRVVVLYPEGMVSPRQEKQLTVWGGNVTAFAVRGDFDACQRLAKRALGDDALRARLTLSSANSINLGRLLPQMAYYANATLRYGRQHGREPGFVVPTGNVGNAAAACWARAAGLPIREVVLATNENRTIVDFLSGGAWRPQPTVPTLATAMDVGDPSNMERLFALFGDEAAVRRAVRGHLVTDEEIRERIRRGPAEWGEIWDPHTATAVAVRERLEGDDWVLVATAHPAKFEGVVEPLIGRTVPLPPELAELLERPSQRERIDPEYEPFRAALLERATP